MFLSRAWGLLCELPLHLYQLIGVHLCDRWIVSLALLTTATKSSLYSPSAGRDQVYYAHSYGGILDDPFGSRAVSLSGHAHWSEYITVPNLCVF